MDEAAPRASISIFAGRTLELARTADGFVLRSGDGTLAARVTPAGAETADGRWLLRNRRGSQVDALHEGSGEVAARYRPGLFGGGTIRVAGGGRYALRPPALREAWNLRRRSTRALLASFYNRGEWDVTLADRAAYEADLPLVLVVTLQALLLESLMPDAAGGPGGPF